MSYNGEGGMFCLLNFIGTIFSLLLPFPTIILSGFGLSKLSVFDYSIEFENDYQELESFYIIQIILSSLIIVSIFFFIIVFIFSVVISERGQCIVRSLRVISCFVLFFFVVLILISIVLTILLPVGIKKNSFGEWDSQGIDYKNELIENIEKTYKCSFYENISENISNEEKEMGNECEDKFKKLHVGLSVPSIVIDVIMVICSIILFIALLLLIGMAGFMNP